MNTLMQMGPMVVMENGHNGHPMHHAPFPQPSQHMQHSTPITSSMNRSQRCGICKGCQCKPCGQCTYCQDSPQFGGPGVKKQSCIERRCLRVLENRLQRDAPTFKARVGCNQCEDCRMQDCQICLVCLDKRFFDNRYMTGAMCAKKRCNNAQSIELPTQSPQGMHDFQQRQAQKRSYEQPPPIHFEMKRRVEMGYNGMPVQQGPPPPQGPPQGHPPTNGRVLTMNPSVNYVTEFPGMAPRMTMPMQMSHPPPQQAPQAQLACPPTIGDQTYLLPSQFGNSPQPVDFYEVKPFDMKPYHIEEIPTHPGDPFIPPSYVPEMKNAVVLQPL